MREGVWERVREGERFFLINGKARERERGRAREREGGRERVSEGGRVRERIF